MSSTIDRDAFGHPLTPEDVERRAQPLSVGYYEDEHFRLVLAFRRWRYRAGLTFAALAIVCSIATYLGYRAERDSTTGLRRNARDAAVTSCLGGAELRLVVADGLDSLRRLAISGTADHRTPRAIVDLFIAQTQPPIDNLLSQAAGAIFHAPLPPGAVSDRVKQEVRHLAAARCERRGAAQFG